ncbi:MAG: DUF488 domain-containing protein [Chitinophagales bacterium]|nr:DUF488 domain-containing protein [Chitinophagales bacterium]MCO5280108.1 DUF488 domain-containing protein [Chitinophagales bacterium]OJV27222.1 MAG: hypothetical protein BGO32_04995 [Bacteroidetes bacterium 37-13]HRN94087.1 DUF488 domain-containing protein [Chitinophagales bacterium]HRP39753.1 DUF488 domain-containing protein [Chitinophagales bacterium]
MKIKRIYEKPDKADGYRILVDRIWPRGISKETAALDEWEKEIAPSTELRKWFGHKPELYPEFKVRYKEELKSCTAILERIKSISKKKPTTLLYSAKDEIHNQAVVLLEVLEKMK